MNPMRLYPHSCLSIEEMEQVCREPIRKKSEVYAAVEAWLDREEAPLRLAHPGKYLLVDASDSRYIIADNAKLAFRMMGPSPPDGSDLLGIQF